MSNEKIGLFVGLNRDTAGDWANRYVKGGFDALCQFNYGTNKSILESHAKSILNSFKEHPPMSTKEARSRIEAMTGCRSLSQVRAFMKRHDLRYIKMGHIPAKADAVKQAEWLSTTFEPVKKTITIRRL